MLLKVLLLVLPLFAAAKSPDSTPWCQDNPDFIDARGKSCSDYDRYDCFEAWRYMNDDDELAYWNCCECQKDNVWCLPGNSEWKLLSMVFGGLHLGFAAAVCWVNFLIQMRIQILFKLLQLKHWRVNQLALNDSSNQCVRRCGCTLR